MATYLESVLYPRLPVALQQAACAVQGALEARRRFGPAFRRRLEELSRSDSWSQGEIAAYQDEQVRSLVRQAHAQVPYYRDLFRSMSLDPRDIRGVDDLPKLPVLTKEDVRQNRERLVAEDFPRHRLIRRNTSGTTGSALSFYSTEEAVAFQWAVWWRHRQRFGLHPGDRHANFTGKLMVPLQQSRPPYWRWNPALNQVLLNGHHFTPGKIEAVVRFLDEGGFAFFSGYPSIIHALVVAAEEAGLRMQNPPPLLVTGAEPALEFQKEAFTRWLGATHTDQYGFSEGCGNASHCEQFRYHEDFEFGVMECLDPEIDAATGGRTGRIVCTGFANHAFPLIRYEVGDTGTWLSPDGSCGCGRSSAVLERVEGRTEDHVITPEGARISRFDYIFKAAEAVRECQVVQERLGEITLRIVRRAGYSTRDERRLREEVRRWISAGIEVRFEYVDRIELEA